MDTSKAILSRRSVAKVTTEKISRQRIEALLQAAVRAPNHYLTQPWRFIVITGDALDRMGDAMADSARTRFAQASDIEARVSAERARPRRAPVIITVIYRSVPNPKAIEVEERYAVGAAIENILLAGHADGLGCYWRTGPAATDANVKGFLELTDEEEVAGFIYVGIPADPEPAEPTARVGHEQITTWMGWEQVPT